MVNNLSISISAKELAAQADILKNLCDDFETLHKSVMKNFDEVNSHWSETLSNNFSLRTKDFDKDFKAIDTSLETGYKAVIDSINTFISLDEALVKQINGSVNDSHGTSSGGFGMAGDSIANVTKDIPTLDPEIEKKWNATLDSLDETLENYEPQFMAKEIKHLLSQLSKSALGTDYIKYIELAENIRKAVVNEDEGALLKSLSTIISMAYTKSVEVDSGLISFVKLKGKSIGLTLLLIKSDSYVMQNCDKYDDLLIQDLKNGDVSKFAYDLIIAYPLETVGKGVVDVSCKLIQSAADSIVEAMTGGMTNYTILDSAIKDKYGISINSVLGDMGNRISDGVTSFHDTTSQLFGLVDYGVKSGINWIKSWGK